jgi:hypothetical protein
MQKKNQRDQIFEKREAYRAASAVDKKHTEWPYSAEKRIKSKKK